MKTLLSVTVWCVLIVLSLLPLYLATESELLQWREPIYIVAGFAGIVAMAAMLFQPLLAIGLLPGINSLLSRKLHRFIGLLLVGSIIVHVAGLWITTPPDVIDALLFRSATPFSIWGVLAMWAVFLSATLVALRHKFRVKPALWRNAHKALAVVIVIGSVVHAFLIDGTMNTVSKYAMCIALLIFLIPAITSLQVVKLRFFIRSDNH